MKKVLKWIILIVIVVSVINYFNDDSKNSSATSNTVSTENANEAPQSADNGSDTSDTAENSESNSGYAGYADLGSGSKVTSASGLYQYLANNNIPINDFSKREKYTYMFANAANIISNYGVMLPSMMDTMSLTSEDVANVFKNTDETGLPVHSNDGEKFYAGTEDNWGECNYMFYGDLKDTSLTGGITGTGVIIGFYNNISSDSGDSYPFAYLRYIGDLKKGEFDGYGMIYHEIDIENQYERGIACLEGQSVESIQNHLDDDLNYLEYEGELDGGKYSGKGNSYLYADDDIRYMYLLDAYGISFSPKSFGVEEDTYNQIKPYIQRENNNVIVITGKFKDDDATDKVETYVYGQLLTEENSQELLSNRSLYGMVASLYS